MEMRKKELLFLFSLIGLLVLSAPVSAHVRYVLTPKEIQKAELGPKPDLFTEVNSTNLALIFLALVAIIVVVFLSVHLRGNVTLDHHLQRLVPYQEYTPLILRVFLGLGLMLSGGMGVLLGPDFHLAGLSAGTAMVLSWIQITAGAFILFGHLIKVAAPAIVLLWVAGLALFGTGIFSHFDVNGIMVYFLLVGCGPLAVDNALVPVLHRRIPLLVSLEEWIEKYRPYAMTFIRVFLGLTLVYLGLTEKILEPQISLMVVEKYTLPAIPNPEIFVLAAGITEIALGSLLVLGALTRFVTFVVVIFVVLGVVVFQEQVLAHADFVGAALALLLSGGGPCRIDEFLAGGERRG
jgi:uncharacterized membrane protein YphA (DoxX/SURF4 family)